MLRTAIQHRFDLTPKQAMALQERLRDRVECRDRLGVIGSVAGVDVGFFDRGRRTRAAVVVLSYPGLEVEEEALASMRTAFPYVPGLLSFRELPAVLAALGRLRRLPDLILCDGQGYAHPRRFGIASHLGVLLDLPTIGVAKTRLIGTHDPVGPGRGDWQPLLDGGEVIGAVLRTRERVKPLYVSIGHRLSLPTAVGHVLRCAPRYRLPETTRRADRLASARGQPRRR